MGNNLGAMIRQGKGAEPADMVLKGGSFFDLVSGRVIKSDVAISGDRIVATCGTFKGKREIDISGKTVVPGFIDTHLHVESSLVTPFEFDRCVLRHGVTTAICDPHEIANVLGAPGIRYFLDCAERTVMDIRVKLSSCVPATHLETSGARLAAADLAPFMDHPKVLGNHRSPVGHADPPPGDPADVLLKDAHILGVGVIWIVMIGMIIYTS